MHIYITYNSSWHNSFLEDSKDRKYIGTSKSLGVKGNYEKGIREISKSTILGILARVSGYIAPLHELRSGKHGDFYYSDIEDKIKFTVKNKLVTEETVFLHNKNMDKDQNLYSGILNDSHPLLTSSISKQIWGVFDLSLNDIFDLITGKNIKIPLVNNISYGWIISHAENKKDNPIKESNYRTEIQYLENHTNNKVTDLNNKLNNIHSNWQGITSYQKQKLSKSDRDMFSLLKEEWEVFNSINENINKGLSVKKKKEQDRKEAAEKANKVPKTNKIDAEFKQDNLYFAAMYIKLLELKSCGTDMSNILTSQGKIPGFSKSSFSQKELTKVLASGGYKINYGNPYPIIKSDGNIEIEIDVDEDRAIEIYEMIKFAKIPNFYVGKKGFGRIEEISIY
jgi:hypothetical protein